MIVDPRAILMFGANVLLLYLMLLVNSALAAWSIYLFLLGPMLVLPVIYLRHSSYFVCTLATGLWVDAALPATFGLFTLGFLVAGAFIFQIRFRFRAEHTYHLILLAHTVNFFCILLVTLFMGLSFLANGGFWMQLAVTILTSHLVLLLVAPWFFNLQRLLFSLCRLDSEPDEFPTL